MERFLEHTFRRRSWCGSNMAIYKAFSNPTTAGVVTGVAAIIVGAYPLKELISTVKERALI